MAEDRAARIAGIRNTLEPTDPSYCAEPLLIEESRWLLGELTRLEGTLREIQEIAEDIVQRVDGDFEDAVSKIDQLAARALAGEEETRP